MSVTSFQSVNSGLSQHSEVSGGNQCKSRRKAGNTSYDIIRTDILPNIESIMRPKHILSKGDIMKQILMAFLAVLFLLGCGGASQDPMAPAIAQAVRQQSTSAGTMDELCGAYAVISVALLGGTSEDVTAVDWSAWSEDNERRVWTVACNATYAVLTEQGEKSNTEEIFRLLVDHEAWELRYIPGRTQEAQLLGTWGVLLPMSLNPATKP